MVANAYSIIQHEIEIKTGIMIHVSVSVRSITHVKKIIVVILGHFFFGGGEGGNSRYLKSIVDDWVIVCNKMTNDADSISTNMTYTIPVNVTNTVSINSNYKEVAWKK